MRTHWIVLIGLALGLALGLYYAWVINPVQYYDSVPNQMVPRYRSRWIQMTAFAYGHTGDIERTRLRLHRLPDGEIRQGLTDALETAVETGVPPSTLGKMASLAKRYDAQSPAIAIYTDDGDGMVVPTAETTMPVSGTAALPEPSPTATSLPPSPTPTINPAQFSIVPTLTPPAPSYVITNVVRTCLPEPRIAVSLTQQVSVTVRGESGLETQGKPNVEIWLLWPEGADRAITGFRPSQGLGYADFYVEPMKTYNLYIESPTGAPLTDLTVDPCETQEETTWSSWLLTVRSTEVISP